MSALSHAAASGDNPDIVKLLLDSGALLNHTSQLSRTPLMLAALSGSVQVARVLCDQDAIDIEAVDVHGFTALTIAARSNKSNMVRFLLEKGANPNHRSQRSLRTPLMEAAYVGSVHAMRELAACPQTDFFLQNDAKRSATWFIINGTANKDVGTKLEMTDMFLEVDSDKLIVNEINIEGNTPLTMMASTTDRPSRIRRLLQLGADIKYQSWVTGESAFHAVAKWATVLNLRELLYAVESATPGEEESAELASQEDRTFDSGDLDHGTPLSYAAGNVDSDNSSALSSQLYASISPMLSVDRPKIRHLVDKLADKFLVLQQKQMQRYQIAQLLVHKGANVNSATLKQRRTPLMFAAKAGLTRIVALLLDNGAEVDMKDKNYFTALSLAAEEGHVETLRRLLQSQASWNPKDKTGATPLILAAKNGHLGVVQFLFETFHPNLSDRDRSGRTALSYAAEYNRVAVVHYLLRCHGQGLELVEVLDRQDETALVWAAKKNQTTLIVQLLIDHGANFRLKDRNNRMPLSHAAEYGSWHVVNLLMEQEEEVNLPAILNWRDHAGRTALSWVAEKNQCNTLRILLERDADPSIGDIKNRTPRMYAMERGHVAAANILDIYSRSKDVPVNILQTTSNAAMAIPGSRASDETEDSDVSDEAYQDALEVNLSSSTVSLDQDLDRAFQDETITNIQI